MNGHRVTDGGHDDTRVICAQTWQEVLSGTARHDVYARTVSRHPTILVSALAVQRRRKGTPMPEWIAGMPRARLGHNYIAALKEITDLWAGGTASIDSIRAALMRAQTLFAARDCRAPTREDVLNGLLRSDIGDSAEFVCRPMSRAARLREKSSRAIGAADSDLPPFGEIHMFTVDLTIRGREAETGADIAFIIDGGERNKPRIAVALLQAKRGNPDHGETLDVARVNKSTPEGEGQYVRLSKMSELGCGTAYLIYHNDKQDPIESPFLPIVKDVGSLTEEETETMRIDLETDTIDLASYLLHLVTHPERHTFARWDDAALMELLQILVESDTRHVVALSPDPEAGHRLNSVLGHLPGLAQGFGKASNRADVPPSPNLNELLKSNIFASETGVPSADYGSVSPPSAR